MTKILRKLIRISPAIVLSFLCIAGLSFYWIADFSPPTHMIVDYANVALKAFGYKMNYENIVVRSNKLIVEGIVIDGPQKVAVAKVEASFTIDPANFKWTVDEVKLKGVHSSVKLSDLKPLIDKLMSIKKERKKSAPSAEPSNVRLDKIVLDDVDLTLYLTDKLDQELRISEGDFVIDLDDKLIEGEVGEVFYNEKKLFDEVKVNAKASKGQVNYLMHNNLRRTKGYWSMEGTADLTEKSNTSLIKFSGIPFFLPEKVGAAFANDKDQLSAIKVTFPLEQRPIMPFKLTYGIANLRLNHPILSSAPIGPVPVQLEVAGDYSLKKDTLHLESGSLKLRAIDAKDSKALAVNFSGDVVGLKNGMSDVYTALDFSIPRSDCDTIARSIPRGLMPVLGDFVLSGQAKLDLSLRVSTKNPEAFQHRLAFDNGCVATPLSSKFSKEAMLRADSQSNPKALQEGLTDPSSANFASSAEISPSLLKAFVAFEDSGFFNHSGFEAESLVHAFRTNFQAGKVEVGGSTISMQMVKNLFLNHERNLQRKLQEIFLTWYVEKTLSKNQILEIYANIIEFGPNIYGVTNAARVMFGKDPDSLSIRESIYLASILPSPVARFKNYCKGSVSKAYSDFLNQRLFLMHSQGRLTDSELQSGLSDEIEFQGMESHPYCRSLASVGPLKSF